CEEVAGPVDVPVPVQAAEERAVIRERLDERVQVVGREPVERCGRLCKNIPDVASGRVEKPVFVARDVSGERVEELAQAAPQVGVELALGNPGLLEVQDVEERVAER